MAVMSELYQLPDGWEWKKLSDVCDSMQGIQLPKVEQICELREGYVRYLYISDFTTDKNIIYVVDQYKNKIVNEHEYVIVNTGATAGKIFHGKRGVLSNNLFKVSNFKNINDRYFYFYYLVLYQNIISNELKQSTQPHLGHKAFNGYDIPLPPIPEQKRIVQKLDALFERIDKAIALLQKNIDAADNFMNSILNDVFSDLDGQHPKRALFSFDSGMSAGGTPLRQNKLFWENGTIEWFSSGELNQLFTKPANEKITQFGLENSSAKIFESGTLLIGMYDTAAMKMSILSNRGSCNQAIVGFKPDSKELNIYFAKYQLEYLKPVILEQRQGVRQKNLNLTKIKNIEISYPDLIIQNKVVDFLDDVSAKIEQVKSAQQQKMQNLLDLKSSILDQAFHGLL